MPDGKLAAPAHTPVHAPAPARKEKPDRTKGTHEVVIERYGYGDNALVEGDRVSDGDTPYDLDDAVKSGAVRKVPRGE